MHYLSHFSATNPLEIPIIEIPQPRLTLNRFEPHLDHFNVLKHFEIVLDIAIRLLHRNNIPDQIAQNRARRNVDERRQAILPSELVFDVLYFQIQFRELILENLVVVF